MTGSSIFLTNLGKSNNLFDLNYDILIKMCLAIRKTLIVFKLNRLQTVELFTLGIEYEAMCCDT